MEEIFTNSDISVNLLIEKIENGELGLPELQRPFVWSDVKVRNLFDSMIRGYPIGYLMLWECPSLEKSNQINTEKQGFAAPKEVIIDGQQRLTSLYAVIKGKQIINSKHNKRNIVISYNPISSVFEVGDRAIQNDPEWIYNISDLFTAKSSYTFIGQFIQSLEAYRSSKDLSLTDDEKERVSSNIEAVKSLKS